MKAALFHAMILVLLAGCANTSREMNVIPWPAKSTLLGGDCELTDHSRIVVRDSSLLPLGEILSDDLHSVAGIHPTVAQDQPRDGDIVLSIDSNLKNEDYVLAADKSLNITGANYNAVEMGTISLLQ